MFFTLEPVESGTSARPATGDMPFAKVVANRISHRDGPFQANGGTFLRFVSAFFTFFFFFHSLFVTIFLVSDVTTITINES